MLNIYIIINIMISLSTVVKGRDNKFWNRVKDNLLNKKMEEHPK